MKVNRPINSVHLILWRFGFGCFANMRHTPTNKEQCVQFCSMYLYCIGFRSYIAIYHLSNKININREKTRGEK